MNLKELSQYYWLCKEIELDTERLKKLEIKAGSAHAQRITGMPRGGNGSQDRIGDYAAEIVDLQAIIAAKRIQCIHERQRIERFITGIPDSQTRILFTLRFIEFRKWSDVAARAGGSATEFTARQIVSRYLRNKKK